MAKQELQTVGKKEVVQGRDTGIEAAITQARTGEELKYWLAVGKKRDEDDCQGRILKAVRLVEFAQMCFYSYPRGGKDIFGGSIKLAMEIARVWGNIDIKQREVSDEADTRTIGVEVTDLETNFHTYKEVTFKKMVQRKSESGATRWVQVDERDLRELENKHYAIITRNAIFELVPRWFVIMVVDKARETIKKNIKKADPRVLRPMLLKEFDAMGIYQANLEKYLGHAFDTTTPEELAELQGVLASIREGVVDRSEYFAPAAQPKGKPEEKPKEQGMTLDQVMEGEVKTEPDKGQPEKAASAPPATPPETRKLELQERESLPPQDFADEMILDEFKKELASRKTPKEVQEYFKQVRAQAKAMKIGDKLMARMSTAVNDRLRELLKESKWTGTKGVRSESLLGNPQGND